LLPPDRNGPAAWIARKNDPKKENGTVVQIVNMPFKS
jgi:hypothetical protein